MSKPDIKKITLHDQGVITCSLTHPSVINDLLHFCKLSAHSIIIIERSEACHWITTLPGFVPYPRNLLLPLAIPLPYKAIDKGQQPSSAGPSHAPVVLPSNQQQLDPTNQTVSTDHMTSGDHMSNDQLNKSTNPEIV